MKIRLFSPSSFLLSVAILLLSGPSLSVELEPTISPQASAKKLIADGLIENWVKIAEVDIDRDGDPDKLLTADHYDSRGNTTWIIYFLEGGQYFRAPRQSSFVARAGMTGAGKLKEFDGNWGIVSYSKGSASTGVVHGVWFEKTGEREVKKNKKKFFRVDVGHKSDTREEHKARIDEIFSRADEDPFEEVKHYTVDEFIEEHGLEIDGEGEGKSDSD